MKLQTQDGLIHTVAKAYVSGRRPNGEKIFFTVLKTKCGVPATGNETTAPSTCC